MLELLWLIPALPLAAFLLLAIAGRNMSKAVISLAGTLPSGLSALLVIILGAGFMQSPPAGYAFSQTLWHWFSVGSFKPAISMHLDSLSLVFIFIITVVGFLIQLYSSSFMQKEEAYARFMAYMNLFIGSMLLLVLAENLLFLYLGWEAVGLCSYLLIGFWYKDPANGYAARKAFIVTRIGDTMLAIGLFLLFRQLGTLNIPEIISRFPQEVTTGSPIAVFTSLMLLGGAIGKSAQLPLQVWLPDAMAGPSPVSALIHAATMVTAGVYLITRTFAVFEAAPDVQMITAIIGAATLLIAGFSALTQKDIKRVLAYSTISQIGYMFLALGIGAYSGAVFHFFTHAFFKALLFLAAGLIIMKLNGEHDMFKMGGLRKSMPFTFWTFLAGAASLSALPLVTAGFYSKDAIIWYSWAGQQSDKLLWMAALLGSLLTALYTFRMVFITFFGTETQKPNGRTSANIRIPLIILAAFSLLAGFINLPHNFGGLHLLSDFLHQKLPEVPAMQNTGMESLMQLISSAVVLVGIFLAWLFYQKKPQAADSFKNAALYRFWASGWGFDRMYDVLFVRPFLVISNRNKHDIIDYISTGITELQLWLHRMLSKTQNGRMRWYAMSLVAGSILAVVILLFRK